MAQRSMKSQGDQFFNWLQDFLNQDIYTGQPYQPPGYSPPAPAAQPGYVDPMQGQPVQPYQTNGYVPDASSFVSIPDNAMQGPVQAQTTPARGNVSSDGQRRIVRPEGGFKSGTAKNVPAAVQQPGWLEQLLSFAKPEELKQVQGVADGARKPQSIQGDMREKAVADQPVGDPARMAEIAMQQELGNRLLDLQGSGIRKAPDMMGTLETRFADRYAGQEAAIRARQSRDAALAESQPQFVPYAMPNADEMALRWEGRRGDPRYGDPGVMRQVQAQGALNSDKQAMGLKWADDLQMLALDDTAARMGVSPNDPAAIQAYRAKNGRGRQPVIGNRPNQTPMYR